MDDDDDLRRIEEKLVEVFPGLAIEACPEPGCICEGRPEEHDPTGGWMMPSEDVLVLPPLDLPKIQMRRGGIKFPRFVVRTHVSGHKRFLRRKQWRLEVQYVHGGRSLNHYMEFTNESAARNAEQIMKFTMQSINDDYNAEKSRK